MSIIILIYSPPPTNKMIGHPHTNDDKFYHFATNGTPYRILEEMSCVDMKLAYI